MGCMLIDKRTKKEKLILYSVHVWERHKILQVGYCNQVNRPDNQAEKNKRKIKKGDKPHRESRKTQWTTTHLERECSFEMNWTSF